MTTTQARPMREIAVPDGWKVYRFQIRPDVWTAFALPPHFSRTDFEQVCRTLETAQTPEVHRWQLDQHTWSELRIDGPITHRTYARLAQFVELLQDEAPPREPATPDPEAVLESIGG